MENNIENIEILSSWFPKCIVILINTPEAVVMCVYVCKLVCWFYMKYKSPKIAKAMLKMHNAEELNLPNTSTTLP